MNLENCHLNFCSNALQQFIINKNSSYVIIHFYYNVIIPICQSTDLPIPEDYKEYVENMYDINY
jgi:hypothetical protein